MNYENTHHLEFYRLPYKLQHSQYSNDYAHNPYKPQL